MDDLSIRDPDPIRQDCARKLRAVEVIVTSLDDGGLDFERKITETA